MNRTPDRAYFDDRELAIMDFAAHWHRAQKRKFTGEPYVNHLAAVAKTVKTYTKNSLMVAAAFCHDLYEDTVVKEADLLKTLADAGYDPKEVEKINKMVWELTDEYEKEKYPDLNRRQRKTQEAQRLWMISGDAQNVKYADLIDNSTDLSINNKSFGKKYLEEMIQILEKMDKGLPILYQKALQTAEEVGEVLAKD